MRDDGRSISSRTAFKQMLNDIVAVLVLHQVLSVLEQLFDQRSDFGQVFQDALQDSATVWVSRQGVDLAFASFWDASDAVGRDTLENALKNVVGVLLKHMREDQSNLTIAAEDQPDRVHT